MLAIDDARDRAARVAARSELTDIRLFSVTAEMGNLPDREPSLTYSFSADVKIQQLEDAPALIVMGEYRVVVQDVADSGAETSSESDPDAAKVAEIAFTMSALFAMEEGSDETEALSADELDAFAQTTGQLALHPYSREFIADLTGRMGLPPLHVGMLKIHLDRRNED